MSSLHSAAALLARSRTARDLGPLVATLGFGAPAPLDAAARTTLGLESAVRRAHVACGAGTLRALLVEVAPGAPVRESVARASSHLAARSPHLLWLVVAVQPGTGALVIAAPSPGARTKISALAIHTVHVMDSDGETLAAMTDAAAGPDLLVHHRWRELLGRDALTRRFYRELERVVFDLAASAHGPGNERARLEVALLYASRLLFLAFLEAKGWLDGDREFLRRAFDDRCATGGDVHRRLLEPLFFGTLNTPVGRRAAAARALGRIPFLNGGLFARTALEKRCRALRFSDAALGALIGGLLARYRVTSREDSSAWSEAAVDPEMLGRAFESLMASEDRRKSGAFYTPAAIIERVACFGLEEALAARGAPAALVHEASSGAHLGARDRALLGTALVGMRVLDPACGSGAFLVYALERLSDLAGAAGDARAVGERRREVLTRSIFGVDVNPTAVWLCELRLWLSVVIDATEGDPLAVTPLPNLDRHVRVGDALAGPAFGDAQAGDPSAPIGRLRSRYARATGARKRALARALDREERHAAIVIAEGACAALAARRRDVIGALRSPDLFARRDAPSTAQRRGLVELRDAARDARRRLATLRAGGPLPFSFLVQFSDAAARGGFDLVVGNPPWVRLHHIPATMRDALRPRYRALSDAAWLPGAEETGAGRGFAAQADLAAVFAERSLGLARPGGTVALLLPAKLWRSLAGGGIRRVIAEEACLRAVEDWAESRAAFDAVVYPSLLVATRRSSVRGEGMDVRVPHQSPEPPVRVAVHRRDDALAWEMPRGALALDQSPGAPWLLLPSDARAGFDRLSRAGPPLSRSSFGRPLLGVKSGCNDAFILTPRPGWSEAGNTQWPVRDATRDGTREGCVEASLLRPLLRGEHVRAWHAEPDDAMLLWTHGSDDLPLAKLPSGAAEWLAPWRRRLDARSDARNSARWWSLFRTEAARCDVPRVVWSDIAKSPRALVLAVGDATVPLNSCYVARAQSFDEALALAALLNSPVAAAWLAAIAEPARGGYKRFLGWTLARFPLPGDWSRAVGILAPVARVALAGSPPSAAALADAAIRAYRVRPRDVSALMTWCLR